MAGRRREGYIQEEGWRRRGEEKRAADSARREGPF
jgi:hypothetical protein